MKNKIVAAGFVFATLAFQSSANATAVNFSFNGQGFSGSGSFNVTTDIPPADLNPNCGTDGTTCRTDPPGVLAITSITGTSILLGNVRVRLEKRYIQWRRNL